MKHHIYGGVPEHLDGQVDCSIRHQQKPRIAASKSCHVPPITSPLLISHRILSEIASHSRRPNKFTGARAIILHQSMHFNEYRLCTVFAYEGILRGILVFGHWTDVSVVKVISRHCFFGWMET